VFQCCRVADVIAAAWNWQFEAMAEGPTLFGAVAKPAKHARSLIRWERHACLAARVRLIKGASPPVKALTVFVWATPPQSVTKARAARLLGASAGLHERDATT